MKTLALLLLASLAAFPAVEGTITNGSTSKPQPGAVVQLYKIGMGGPQFLTMAKSDAQGHFAINQELQPGGPHLLMTSFAGVNYNTMIPPGRPSTGLEVTVYNSSTEPGQAKISGHTVLLEPSAGQVNVTESFFFNNPSSVTWHDPEKGSLRFTLPKGVEPPKIRITEPGSMGMPIQREAEQAKTAGEYKLDFPIKPGETEFDLAYTAPLPDSGEFSGKVLLPVSTRFAVPSTVTLDGDGLKSLGKEPQSQANLYEVANPAYRVTVKGTGALASANASAGGGGGAMGSGGDTGDDNGPTMSVILPPGFENQQIKILVLVLIALALGFVLLYRKGRIQRG